MTADAARLDMNAATMETQSCARDDRERVIEALAQLVSSGDPFSEILDTAKRLAEDRKTSEPEVPVRPGGAENSLQRGESSSEISQSEDAEPVDWILADKSGDASAVSAPKRRR
jgi:hypothetical protein